MLTALGIVAKFHCKYEANLSELIKFYYPRNYQKTIVCLMISGGIEINRFAEIYLILEAKLGDGPLAK